MLTKGDDYPIHQTPEPIATPIGERNFYDRYFFNGYAPDGSGFFAAAFGVYPQLGVVDAHFNCIIDGVQHCLHVSREMRGERMDLSCGPISIEIIEPLQKMRVVVSASEELAADITMTGRAFPIEEPRFTYRQGERLFMDYTRLTQNCTCEGWYAVDGRRHEIAAGSMGTRDRSWGIRPVGAGDAQPPVPRAMPQFFWQWTPINMPERSLFFHLNADGEGRAWNTRAVIAPNSSDADGQRHMDSPQMDAPLQPGTRWPDRAQLSLPGAEEEERFVLEPIGRFQMRGLGYTSPTWGHGHYQGALKVGREDIVLADCDPTDPTNLHVQLPCRVTGPGGEQGIGVFEQMAIGAYGPLGLTGISDPASG